MKSKRFIRAGLILLILTIGLILFPTVKKYSSNIRILSFLDNTTYEERPLSEVVNTFVENNGVNKEALSNEIKNIFGFELAINDEKPEKITEELIEKALAKYEEKEKSIGTNELRELERVVMLKVVDQKWMDHIDAMEELKNGIGLRAYGQKDPVVQYRIEGFDMFDEMISDIKIDVVKILINIEKAGDLQRKHTVNITNAAQEVLNSINVESTTAPAQSSPKVETVVNKDPKVGRNDPCPCGSGKKYKNCCGKQ